jgi:hypothetical protein
MPAKTREEAVDKPPVPSAEQLHEFALRVRPQYARTPADAVQCQLDAIAEAVRLRNTGSNLPLQEWMNARARVDDVRQFTTAPLYLWTARIAEVVEHASRSYPLQRETFLPTLPRAFCVFERPVLFAVIDGVRSGLSTLTWTSGIDEATRVLKLRIRGLVWTPPHCSVCFAAEITDPTHITVPDDDSTFEAEVRTIYRWICAASMFVQQRIAEHASVRAGKHVAKRAATLHVPPTCQVVQMRRLDRRRQEAVGDHDTAIDWQCQWLVRGHWRQQFYPKANRHVPRWIAPYIKGPHDKPMKAPAPTVFVVTR